MTENPDNEPQVQPRNLEKDPNDWMTANETKTGAQESESQV